MPCLQFQSSQKRPRVIQDSLSFYGKSFKLKAEIFFQLHNFEEKTPMNWIELTSIEQLNEIKAATGYSVIFKHSTRCSVSSMAKRRFELDWEAIPETTPLYFLDLIRHRDISNSIAGQFNVHHQSPQLLIIKHGECIYETSHGEISAEETAEQIA